MTKDYGVHMKAITADLMQDDPASQISLIALWSAGPVPENPYRAQGASKYRPFLVRRIRLFRHRGYPAKQIIPAGLTDT